MSAPQMSFSAGKGQRLLPRPLLRAVPANWPVEALLAFACAPNGSRHLPWATCSCSTPSGQRFTPCVCRRAGGGCATLPGHRPEDHPSCVLQGSRTAASLHDSDPIPGLGLVIAEALGCSVMSAMRVNTAMSAVAVLRHRGRFPAKLFWRTASCCEVAPACARRALASKAPRGVDVAGAC